MARCLGGNADWAQGLPRREAVQGAAGRGEPLRRRGAAELKGDRLRRCLPGARACMHAHVSCLRGVPLRLHFCACGCPSTFENVPPVMTRLSKLVADLHGLCLSIV
jgi:hypothetical protein